MWKLLLKSVAVAVCLSTSTTAFSPAPGGARMSTHSTTVCHAQVKRTRSFRPTVSLTHLNSNKDTEVQSSTDIELDDAQPRRSTISLTSLMDSTSVPKVERAQEAPLVSLSRSDESDIDLEAIKARVFEELKETAECLGIAVQAIGKSNVTAEDIVLVCDTIDELVTKENLFVSKTLELRKQALEFQRYEMLVKLMKADYDAYVATASFLSPSRIPRAQLPNVQDVPINMNAVEPIKLTSEDGAPLVADCELKDMQYNDSPLDKLLLGIFRKLVAANTGGVTSDKPGIEGLLDQGRQFMLKPGQTPEAQHRMVYETLGGLMTPVLPPFYRIFMSGIIPKVGSNVDGKQIGPWFYAPFLTSFVTPTFFAFLVGPSTPNRRKDGNPGGLLVEKCKFLQESGCKGLCLNQCKLPAQQFFREELGLPLTVSPNFATQECQWSFGEVPLPVDEDPSFPKGCLSGCESRKGLAGTSLELCH